MSYGYAEKEFGLSNIINDISNQISRSAEKIRWEKVIGEVERVMLRDISLHILPAVGNYDEVKIFTHRLGVSFYGAERGKYFNVLTFNCSDIYEQEYQVFMPDDFEIVYEDRGIRIESKYVLPEEEQELINFMNKIKYRDLYDLNFQAEVLRLLNKIGYEVENDFSD